MNRRIIYSRPDGGVNVAIPCRSIEDDHLTDDQIFQRSWDRLPPEAIDPKVITIDDIPPDRVYRSAWVHDGEKIQVDMDKAKDIHLDRIRAVRNGKLAALDIETIKALGIGDTKMLAEVETIKQTLRDIPTTLDLASATTPEELTAIWPAELK